MILIGQYDSPFVRRVAVTLNLYRLPFERRVLSVFRDFEQVLELNPLGKVPILQLDGGESLFDSRIIIDYLDHLISEENRLLPSEPLLRREVLRIEAVALGLAEKSYERGVEFARRQPDKIDHEWAERLGRQILSALTWLESQAPAPWFCGNRITRADITCCVAVTYLRQKRQVVLNRQDFPRLWAHCDHCESLAVFKLSPYSAAEATQSGWKQSDDL